MQGVKHEEGSGDERFLEKNLKEGEEPIVSYDIISDMEIYEAIYTLPAKFRRLIEKIPLVRKLLDGKPIWPMVSNKDDLIRHYKKADRFMGTLKSDKFGNLRLPTPEGSPDLTSSTPAGGAVNQDYDDEELLEESAVPPPKSTTARIAVGSVASLPAPPHPDKANLDAVEKFDFIYLAGDIPVDKYSGELFTAEMTVLLDYCCTKNNSLCRAMMQVGNNVDFSKFPHDQIRAKCQLGEILQSSATLKVTASLILKEADQDLFFDPDKIAALQRCVKLHTSILSEVVKKGFLVEACKYIYFEILFCFFYFSSALLSFYVARYFILCSALLYFM